MNDRNLINLLKTINDNDLNLIIEVMKRFKENKKKTR